MSLSHPRKSLFNTNCYQRPIVLTALVPAFAFCALATGFVLYLHKQIVHYIVMNAQIDSLTMINNGSLLIIISIWTFFLLVYIWSQLVSSRLVGAFERVVRELDDAIENKKYDAEIHARDYDFLPNQLLKRINTLLNVVQTSGA